MHLVFVSVTSGSDEESGSDESEEDEGAGESKPSAAADDFLGLGFR